MGFTPVVQCEISYPPRPHAPCLGPPIPRDVRRTVANTEPRVWCELKRCSFPWSHRVLQGVLPALGRRAQGVLPAGVAAVSEGCSHPPPVKRTGDFTGWGVLSKDGGARLGGGRRQAGGRAAPKRPPSTRGGRRKTHFEDVSALVRNEQSLCRPRLSFVLRVRRRPGTWDEVSCGNRAASSGSGTAWAVTVAAVTNDHQRGSFTTTENILLQSWRPEGRPRALGRALSSPSLSASSFWWRPASVCW